MSDEMPDMVNHPPHYGHHPSGVSCIEITRHMGFNLGNAVKYIWRCDLKGDAVEDLKKAVWYLQDEIAKREKANAQVTALVNAAPAWEMPNPRCVSSTRVRGVRVRCELPPHDGYEHRAPSKDVVWGSSGPGAATQVAQS